MVELFEALDSITLAIKTWYYKTDFSFWVKERSFIELFPYIIGVGLFAWILFKLWRLLRTELRKGAKIRKKERLEQRMPVKKEVDEDLIKIGVLSLTPLAEDRQSESPVEGIYLKAYDPDPVELSLARGSLLLNTAGQWYLCDRSRDLATGHFLLAYFDSMWDQYKRGEKTLKYGISEKDTYLETQLIPALSGEFLFDCKEGQYCEISAEKNKYQQLSLNGVPTVRRLVFFRYIEEEDIADAGCEMMLFEEITDIKSEKPSARLWKVSLIPQEEVSEIKQIQEKETKHLYPNGSRMKG